jgi:hypothetical protein
MHSKGNPILQSAQQRDQRKHSMDRHPSAQYADRPVDSGSDPLSAESDFSDDSLSDYDSIRPSTHALGLSKQYVSGWSLGDAFREFYQNW